MLIAFAALLKLYNLLVSISTNTSVDIRSPIGLKGQKYDDVKVPVILGVMSRCPDALLCESVFDTVLEKVEGKVNLTLSFLGE